MRASLIIAAFLVSAPPRANTAEAEQAYFTGKTVRMIVVTDLGAATTPTPA